MRDIIFRGKREDNGEWVEGDLFRYESGEMAIHSGFSRYGYEAVELFGRNKVIPETVCQYTGLTDKNGRKIFEGDIIEITDTFNKIICGVVYWCDSAFWVDCSQPDDDECFYALGHLSDCVEVIGNEYDNPELLEVRDNG